MTEQRIVIEHVEDEHGYAETVICLHLGKVVNDPVDQIAAMLGATDYLMKVTPCPGHEFMPNRAERRRASRRR